MRRRDKADVQAVIVVSACFLILFLILLGTSCYG